MSKRTKLLVITLMVVFILAFTAIPGIAAVSDPDTAGGSITIDKTATATADPQIFNVTLDVSGTPPPAKKLDIILVIDSSTSMNETVGDKTVLFYAEQAAKSFATQMLPTGTSNKVAVIDFHGNDHGRRGDDWSGVVGDLNRDTDLRTGFTSILGTVTSAIDGIGTAAGTDTQAGFQRAKNLMVSGGRSDADKIIILLSDGVPNLSIGKHYSENEPTSHNENTIAAYTEGQACVTAGYKVFTIGLFGAISNTAVKNLAIDTLTRAQNCGFYQSNSAVDLSGIYTTIANSINYYAANAVITDQIYGDFDLVAGSVVTKINGAAVTTPACTYNSVTKTLSWPVGTLTASKTATLTYQIRYRDTLPGGDNIPTNTSANINYTDGAGLANQTLLFPVPKVNVHVYGSIKIKKLVSNESGCTQYFPIQVTGGPNNLTWNVLAQKDGTYVVGHLLAGDYTIIETVPMDYALDSISGPGTVTLSAKKVTFTLTQTEIFANTVKEFTYTNENINTPYFWGVDRAMNVFHASASFPL